MRKICFLILLISLAFSACQKNIGEEITYNAAYVVNGEDHSISVINLETNEVTIERHSWSNFLAISAEKV